MDKISKKKKFYGDILYGFLKGRSTSNYVLILLAANRKAKRKNHVLSLVFFDKEKANGSDGWELLFLKLESLGFGSKVKSVIQSMY